MYQYSEIIENVDLAILTYYKKAYEINPVGAKDAFLGIPLRFMKSWDRYEFFSDNGFEMLSCAANIEVCFDEERLNEYDDCQGLTYLELVDENIHKANKIKASFEKDPNLYPSSVVDSFMNFFQSAEEALTHIEYNLGEYIEITDGVTDENGIVKSKYIEMHSYYHPNLIPAAMYELIVFTEMLKKAVAAVSEDVTNEAQ